DVAGLNQSVAASRQSAPLLFVRRGPLPHGRGSVQSRARQQAVLRRRFYSTFVLIYAKCTNSRKQTTMKPSFCHTPWQFASRWPVLLLGFLVWVFFAS